MTTPPRLAVALSTALLCILAAGCDRGPDAPPADADAATQADTGKTFIGRQAAKAIGKAGEALKHENIRIGDHAGININGRDYGFGDATTDLPRAEITPGGELLIEGKAVPATPEQRARVLEHRRHLERLALAGMAIGAQGADIAGTALTGIGGALFGGEEGRKAYEARVEAEAAKIEGEARKLCALLPPLYASQQALAESLPAFAPYATMTPKDIDDCGKESDGDAATAESGSATRA